MRQLLQCGSKHGTAHVDRLGQAPVDHESFAVVTQHDVAGLEITVNDRAAMGIIHRVADIDKPAQQLAEFDLFAAEIFPRFAGGEMVVDGLLQTAPANESHSIVRAAIGIGAETVNGHDPRMLQASGDLGFLNKPRPRFGIIGEPSLDFFESYFTSQFEIFGDGDFAQAPLRVFA